MPIAIKSKQLIDGLGRYPTPGGIVLDEGETIRDMAGVVSMFIVDCTSGLAIPLP